MIDTEKSSLTENILMAPTNCKPRVPPLTLLHFTEGNVTADAPTTSTPAVVDIPNIFNFDLTAIDELS